MIEIKTISTGSDGNAYYISDGYSSALLDAGMPLRAIQIALGHKLATISGALITHSHGDHAKAVKDLARLGVDIYISSAEAEALKLYGHRIHAVKPLKTFKCDGFAVTPFDVVHDTPEPLGFLIKSTATGDKLLYFTDTAYLKYTFRGISYILGECNHSRRMIDDNVKCGDLAPELAARIVKSHMSIDRFEEFLKASDLSELKELHLIHTSDGNGNTSEFTARIAKIVPSAAIFSIKGDKEK